MISRVLLIKTSSLGDVIHTLPALTDALQHFPNIQFDWVVEESFQSVPSWHPAVGQIFPVALRRWRKHWLEIKTTREIVNGLQKIRAKPYDAILDVQGLLKSAALAFAAKGPRYGFSWGSIREKTASLFYQRRFEAPLRSHAVDRTRGLFAKALGYPLPPTFPDYGIDLGRLSCFSHDKPYYVFLNNTTWDSKHWPTAYWVSLAKRFEKIGVSIFLLPGNEAEEARAQEMSHQVSNIQILPKQNLAQVAGVLLNATAVVTVDTGLGHLAAALGVPTVSLYGPSDPKRTGTIGRRQIHMSAEFSCSPCLSRTCRYPDQKSVTPPCFTTVSPDQVFEQLQVGILS